MNIGVYICIAALYFMMAVAYSDNFRENVFDLIRWVYNNKISVAFFVMFVLFFLQVVQIKKSLSEMSGYMSVWDAAISNSD